MFLHPAQRPVIEKDYGSPFLMSVAAGTGKTIVAIHRAVFLARATAVHQDAPHHLLRHPS